MAPVAATVALSHVDGVSDNARARELYKYYQPNAPVNADAHLPDPSTTSPTADEAEIGRDVKVSSNATSSKISSPDTALTAFCQLTTWRTGAQRAMISVIDAETQYFIAESTKTVDLMDNSKYEPGDEIWMGCANVTKAGRLCERTISVPPTTNGDYPCFIVDDLSKDERFNTLPFVTGPPFLKFYAGVPLITKRSIPIGSLFIVDDRPGPRVNREKIHYMGTMAKTIMKHLEITREVEEHRRGMKMSRGLASFVEGRAELAEADIDAEYGEGNKIAGQFEPEHSLVRTKSKGGSAHELSTSVLGSATSIERKEKDYSTSLAKTVEAIQASNEARNPSEASPDLPGSGSASIPHSNSYGESNVTISSPHGTQDRTSPSEMASETSSMRLLFSRAANLIREAFELDGGAVFYDAQIGFSVSVPRKPDSNYPLSPDESYTESPPDSHASGDDQTSSGEQLSDGEGKSTPPSLIPQRSPLGLGEGSFSRSSTDTKKTVEILGFSTPEASSIHGDDPPGPRSFSPFHEKVLHTFLRRYPRGKLWTFDSDGEVSSSSDEETFKRVSRDPIQRNKDAHRQRLRNKKNKSDARFLLKHFPGVRQLLFVPLWDAGRSRWLSSCFAWSAEPTRILSKNIELGFLVAFGNSVMAEWSRIDTEIADQKKGDFIGSISHELRSPLHGILASAEFLSEVTTGWESSLVETIDSCGRTLLDTINHILDYSKINHFENNWRKSKRSGGMRQVIASKSGTLALRQSDLPMLNLFQDVDISVICEEVVESVFAGHVFQNTTAQSFDMVQDSRTKMLDPMQTQSISGESGGERRSFHTEVVVILDIDQENYQFTTQPGALRRLIMNLLGNALKYTSHGYVWIKLHSTDMEAFQNPGTGGAGDNVPRSSVVLTVTDTGKGISPDFLRSKLFTPFAQENSLSSGTGLGLSIVRKIVTLLEGDITIDSEVGRGTQVRVTLPLLREMPKSTDAAVDTPKSVFPMNRGTNDAIVNLRALVKGQKVSLHGFDLDIKDPIAHERGQLLKASVTTFLVNWYGMRVVPLGQKANIIISNEGSTTALSLLAQQAGSSTKNSPAIIVLRSHTAKFGTNMSPDSACKIGFVGKPVGPLKLARAISQCLEGVPTSATPRNENLPQPAESTDLSNVFEELSLSPRGGEVLDNTRMAADSDNARKAIESPTPNATAEKHAEFPFPKADERPPYSKSQNQQADSKAVEQSRQIINPAQTTTTAAISSGTEASAATSVEVFVPQPKLKSPSLLLVDDNHINLRLLSTYLKRRNYEVVDEAQNGLEAVNKVQDRAEGYDIIFMDITMPILDGFGATREIRAIEESRKQQLLTASGSANIDPESLAAGGSPKEPSSSDLPQGTPPIYNPALIIAFTGRSSIEDQTEAVRVGIDLFMTKPVAFKEVGKIIDNWVANKERDSRGLPTPEGNSGRGS